MISLRACGNGPRLPMLSPPNPDLKTQKSPARAMGRFPGPLEFDPLPVCSSISLFNERLSGFFWQIRTDGDCMAQFTP